MATIFILLKTSKIIAALFSFKANLLVMVEVSYWLGSSHLSETSFIVLNDPMS